MIMKLTQFDGTIEYFQICNFSQGVCGEGEDKDDTYHMVRYEGNDYEFSALEFCINEEDGLKSYAYKTIELLTDALVVIDTVNFNMVYYEEHKADYITKDVYLA